jgi:imidazole glycerol-phosphate synthase subunit HisH
LIVDARIGNLDSISRAVEECGGTPLISCEKKDFEQASHIILPGVGAFSAGMKNIREKGLDQLLRQFAIEKRVPLLGICLGMQLLASKGWENGEENGLDFLPGEVIRLKPDTPTTRIPHVGWDEVQLLREIPLFDGIDNGSNFYFVHSYHMICREPALVLATTPYCGGFTSVIGKQNILGVQFHPEKSQQVGFHLLKNFIKM